MRDESRAMLVSVCAIRRSIVQIDDDRMRGLTSLAMP